MPSAVIDIGTNTLLLLIVDDALAPVVDVCRFGRLGKGLDASRALATDTIATSLEICREYRRLLDDHGVERPTVVGTQALREATNAAAFVGPAQDILGASIEIIDGTREAALAYESVARTFPELAGSPYVVVDVGGGSTEIVGSDGARIVTSISVPIGAVRLTERFLAHDPPTADEARALFTEIDRALEHHLGALALPHGTPLVATAGTATTLAALARRLDRYDAEAVTGVRLDPLAIDSQLARLLSSNLAARRALRGMEPGRADVIVGGVAILARLANRLGASVVITADRGVRWGLAYECSAGAR